MTKDKSLLKNKIIVCFLLTLVGCQTYAPVSNQKTTNQNNSAKSNISPDSVSASKLTPVSSASPSSDEEIIKEIIKKSPEFFPGDIYGDIDSSQATVPNNGGVVFATVPNNGGVVFVADPETTSASSFTTQALRPIQRIEFVQPQSILDRVRSVKEKVVKRILPKIIRKTVDQPEKVVSVNFNNDKTRADVIVKTTYQRELLNRDTLKEVSKLKEQSVIKSVFVKENDVWKLSQVSPIELTPFNNTTQVKFDSVKLIAYDKDNQEQYKTIDIDLTKLKDKSSLVNISRGQILTFQVKMSGENKNSAQPLQLWLRVSDNKFRLPLYDDGSESNISGSSDNPQISGDTNKNDDIYTGNMVIKNKTGINYLTIEIAKPASSDADVFPSISKSIPFLIN